MKCIAACLLALAVTIFATPGIGQTQSAGEWMMQGAAPEKIQRDKKECLEKSQRGAGVASRVLQPQRFSRCMKDKGYRQVKQ